MMIINPAPSPILEKLAAEARAASEAWRAGLDAYRRRHFPDATGESAERYTVKRFEATETGGALADAYVTAQRRHDHARSRGESIDVGGSIYALRDLNQTAIDAVYTAVADHATEHGVATDLWPEEDVQALVEILDANPRSATFENTPNKWNADRTVEERAHWIAEKHGVEAAQIVVALQGELSIKLERAYDLAVAGDPKFRKACEKHLVALRAKRREDLAEHARQQAYTDAMHARRSLEEHIQGTALLLTNLRSQREYSRGWARAGGNALNPESVAAQDAEIVRLEEQLARLQGERAKLDAPQAAA
jgi:hypothetical protein